MILAVGGGSPLTFIDWLWTASQILAFPALVWSFALPIVAAYGMARSQLPMSLGTTMLPMLGFGAIRAVARFTGGNAIVPRANDDNEVWHDLLAMAAGPFLLPLVGVLVGVSYVFAVHLYERREF